MIKQKFKVFHSMCCFRLHFSDFNVLFKKKIKNVLQFAFEKNNLLCKKREKITCHEEKSQPPLDIKWSVPNCELILSRLPPNITSYLPEFPRFFNSFDYLYLCYLAYVQCIHLNTNLHKVSINILCKHLLCII